MTDFYVNLQGLKELALLLDRAKGDVDAGRTYLDQANRISFSGEGLINKISGNHKAAIQGIDEWLRKLSVETTGGTSKEVTASANRYRTDDDAAIRRFDAAYPETYVSEIREHTGYVPIEPPEGTAPFGDVYEPGKYLGEVKDYTDELNGSFDWWDLFSPMAQFGNAIEAVTWIAAKLGWMEHPINPQDEIVKPLVGDWAGVRAAADVFSSLGDALHSIGSNLHWASQGTELVWRGNAGDGCAIYLMNVGNALHKAPPPLDALAEEYKNASEAMVEYRDLVVNVLNEIGDAAIQAAIAAGVTGGSASTGVGAPVSVISGAYTAWMVSKVVDGIMTIFDIVGKVDMLWGSVKAGLTDFGSIDRTAAMPHVPTRPGPR
jgi:hypothetical protein